MLKVVKKLIENVVYKLPKWGAYKMIKNDAKNGLKVNANLLIIRDPICQENLLLAIGIKCLLFLIYRDPISPLYHFFIKYIINSIGKKLNFNKKVMR
jgi:hypothetical protein